MDEQQREHLKDLRRRHERRLRELERQAATFGASTPPEVRIEIEDIHAEITRIDASLDRPPAVEPVEHIPRPKANRHNLPAPTTSLIGRGDEVAQIRALVRRADVRLVTLTGRRWQDSAWPPDRH